MSQGIDVLYVRMRPTSRPQVRSEVMYLPRPGRSPEREEAAATEPAENEKWVRVNAEGTAANADWDLAIRRNVWTQIERLRWIEATGAS